MIEKVYRNLDGKVINIGEWDYMITYDNNENEIINNPIPDGVTFDSEEIQKRDDGGLEVVEKSV